MCSKWYSQAQWWDSGGRHRERGHAVIILLLQSLMCRFSIRIMVAFRCIRMGDVGVASTDPKNITVNISSQPCMTQEVVWGSLTILPYIYTYVYIYIHTCVYIYIHICSILCLYFFIRYSYVHYMFIYISTYQTFTTSASAVAWIPLSSQGFPTKTTHLQSQGIHWFSKILRMSFIIIIFHSLHHFS